VNGDRVDLPKYIEAAVARGDYRQAIGYVIQTRRKNVPEDVDAVDFEVAMRPGVGSRAWRRHYTERRTS
jgi:hypothetical protein